MRPTHVEFTPVNGDTTFAIVARGELTFEVGVRGDDSRFFVFGYDVDVYAPDAGYLQSDGVVRSRTEAKVNWGSIGATNPAHVKDFATILGIAADIAQRVNRDLGF